MTSTIKPIQICICATADTERAVVMYKTASQTTLSFQTHYHYFCYNNSNHHRNTGTEISLHNKHCCLAIKIQKITKQPVKVTYQVHIHTRW